MTLLELGKALNDEYIKLVKENGKVASGTLANTTYEVEVKNNHYLVYFNLPEYWKYIENGRLPGKFPPVDKIKSWIEIKHIVPYPDKYGRVPTTDQLAFIISKSIADKGIKPVPLMKQALDNTDNYINLFINTLLEEIQKEINDIL